MTKTNGNGKNGHSNGNGKSKPIGEVLKAARLRRGITADKLAEEMNVARSRIYMWEAGDYVFPKNLASLSILLHLSLKRLQQINGQPS